MPKQIAKEIELLYAKLYNKISMVKFGEQLPSYRQLLQEYDCSRQVLNKTLQKLQADNVISIRDRVGIFANLKNNNLQKKVIFAHIDWVCAHIQYFKNEFEKILTEQENCIFLDLPFAPGTTRELIEKLKNSNADLILLDLEDFDYSTLHQLEPIADKIIFFECTPNIKTINTIDLQAHFAGMLAAKHLIDLGHKEIALIVSEPRLLTNRERIYGFLDYLKLAGIKPKIIDCKIKSGFASASISADFINSYLKNNPIDFTACFIISNTSAVEIIKIMQEYNIRIPEDLSVVACGGENSEMLDKFDLSSISYNYKKIVETTIKCIEQFFRTGKCGITRIHPILTQRNSSLQYSKKGEIA